MSSNPSLDRDIEAVKRAADAQRPRSFAAAETRPMTDAPADPYPGEVCTCPSIADLDPNCPTHGTPAALTAEYGDPPDPGTPVVVSPDGTRQGLREWALGCTCPGDPSASAAGWNPACPLHGETQVVRAFGMTTEELAAQAEAGYPVCEVCRGVGGHTSNCPAAPPGPLEQALRDAEGQTPTLGQIAEQLRSLKASGVTLESLTWVAREQVWFEESDAAAAAEAMGKRFDAVMDEQYPTTGQRARRICETAADLVNNDRNAVYGDAEVNFTETGDLWAVVFGHDVTPEQVAICMALVKVARLVKSPDHADSWTDGVGYLALGGGIASRPGRHRAAE